MHESEIAGVNGKATARKGRADYVYLKSPHGDGRWDRLDGHTGIYIAGFGPYVKIGHSANIGRRLYSLEFALPDLMILYKVIRGATIQEEKALHKRFAPLRSKNEWYHLEGEIAAFVDAETAEEMGLVLP